MSRCKDSNKGTRMAKKKSKDNKPPKKCQKMSKGLQKWSFEKSLEWDVLNSNIFMVYIEINLNVNIVNVKTAYVNIVYVNMYIL